MIDTQEIAVTLRVPVERWGWGGERGYHHSGKRIRGGGSLPRIFLIYGCIRNGRLT